ELEARPDWVVRVLREGGQGDRPGHGDLDRKLGLRSQEGRVAGEHGLRPRDRADRPRYGRRPARSRDGRARLVDVEPGQGRGQPAEVALATYLAVADDIDTRALPVTHDQPRPVRPGLLAE